jgi:UDP-2-acetamido-2,6-beta-L-arabino-hexul-4-ose reductase
MSRSPTRVLITGANGFIGKNLQLRLSEFQGLVVSTFVRADDAAKLPELVAQADAVVHLAGENRPDDESAFWEVNVRLTQVLCNTLRAEAAVTRRKLPLLLASSSQAERDNPYGRSKLAAEQAVQALAQEVGNPVAVFRLPGIFGKWCKPNYNSVVATFCHNLARGLPIQISDPGASVQLVYVDDVVSSFVSVLQTQQFGLTFPLVLPQYTITLGELAEQLKAFDACRGAELKIQRVGTGLLRALYATYVSYMPKERFSYEVPQYSDARGVFVEMLKTSDSGQFSYFTAHPGERRGGHYHHTKSEKFLVIKGQALFRFRHLLTSELVELRTSGDKPQVVDSIPGWAHDIMNVGENEMIVILWASENFDRQEPDTVAIKV